MISAKAKNGCDLIEEIQALEQRIELIEREPHQLTQERDDGRRYRPAHGIGRLTRPAWVASPAHPITANPGATSPPGSVSLPASSAPPTADISGASPSRAISPGAGSSSPARAQSSPRAKPLKKTEPPRSRRHGWALELEPRVGHNKATVALANKLARIGWAVWQPHPDFSLNHAST